VLNKIAGGRKGKACEWNAASKATRQGIRIPIK